MRWVIHLFMPPPRAHPTHTQWFTETYLPSQTVVILRGFATIIEGKTGQWLGIRSGEKKQGIVQK